MGQNYKVSEIGKVNDVQKKLQIVMNIMSYYPFIELGIAIESIKYEIEKSKREREKEYYAKNKRNYRGGRYND